MIAKDWKKKFDDNELPQDLVFSLLNGLEFPKDKEWDIASYNVAFSNYEQSMALGYGIREDIPLSVVSGPPGTGKSQLAVNLISTMNQQDKNVLFSSRNHKAVDVVVDRYNPIFSYESAIDRVAASTNVEWENSEDDKFEYQECYFHNI